MKVEFNFSLYVIKILRKEDKISSFFLSIIMDNDIIKIIIEGLGDSDE